MNAPRPIQAGDLAYVAHPCPCCGDTSAIGITFRVESIRLGRARCPISDSILGPEPFATFRMGGRLEWVSVSELRRIDPPAQLEQAPRRAQVPA